MVTKQINIPAKQSEKKHIFENTCHKYVIKTKTLTENYR